MTFVQYTISGPAFGLVRAILSLGEGQMIDFHSHILPQMDDGADIVETSLAMLRRSFLQGVDIMVSTSHFYADEEYPMDFLRRRKQALEILCDAMFMSPEVYPVIVPGAEVLYFPGISQAEEIPYLTIGDSPAILVEPPMAPWSDEMLDDIAQMHENLGCIPVIAHVDRFMQILSDETLVERVRERNLLVQVNGEYFLNPQTVHAAVRHLKRGSIHFVGSDCHNLTSRGPNLGAVWKVAKEFGVEWEFRQMHGNALKLLRQKGKQS